MKKIIFLIESKFNQRDYNRFGIKIIKNRGYSVEIWDFTSMFRKEYHKSYTPPDYVDLDFLFPITCKDEFLTKINNLDKGVIVLSILGNSEGNLFIYKTLQKHSIHYGINLLGSQPKLELLSSLQLATNIHNPFKIIELVIKKFKRAIKGGKHVPGFILCGGKADIDDAKSWVDNTKIILVHALDYDLFLEEKKTTSNGINRDYAVFIDQHLYYHPDIYGKNYRSGYMGSNADWYYEKIKKFFLKVEKDLKLEIIIASHPRVNYKNNFKGRKVIKGKTNQLIKHSKLVLAHYSIAVNFAVLYKKPVMFVTSTNRNFHKHYRMWTGRFAKELGNIPIDVNKNVSAIQIPIVNEEKYTLYKENYIKMEGTPEKNTWEIFADYCEGLS